MSDKLHHHATKVPDLWTFCEKATTITLE